MYPSPSYPTFLPEAETFVASQRHGTLIATAPGGFPQTSILPFVKSDNLIEVHCVQEDPTFLALQANSLATFLVSDFLAFSPHHWVDERDGGRATLHFRAVAYECEASLSTDPAAVAAALHRLLEVREPGASYEPMKDGDFYGARLRRLAAVCLRIVSTRAKFKVGPAGPPDVRLRVVEGLRTRGEPSDARAADLIEAATPPAGSE